LAKVVEAARKKAAALEEAHKKALEEAHKKALEEAHKKALEEAHKKALEEAHKKALEEAHKKALEEAHKKALEEAHKKALEEAHKKALEEAHKKALEEEEAHKKMVAGAAAGAAVGAAVGALGLGLGLGLGLTTSTMTTTTTTTTAPLEAATQAVSAMLGHLQHVSSGDAHGLAGTEKIVVGPHRDLLHTGPHAAMQDTAAEHPAPLEAASNAVSAMLGQLQHASSGAAPAAMQDAAAEHPILATMAAVAVVIALIACMACCICRRQKKDSHSTRGLVLDSPVESPVSKRSSREAQVTRYAPPQWFLRPPLAPFEGWFNSPLFRRYSEPVNAFEQPLAMPTTLARPPALPTMRLESIAQAPLAAMPPPWSLEPQAAAAVPLPMSASQPMAALGAPPRLLEPIAGAWLAAGGQRPQ
jgi:hypothetical protein